MSDQPRHYFVAPLGGEDSCNRVGCRLPRSNRVHLRTVKDYDKPKRRRRPRSRAA